jgi:signal transduction histidine kinase
MEAKDHVTFIETLLPFVGIVFLIAVGVVLLTQQFRKNLYREQLEQEALKNQHQTELLRSSILVQEQERKRIAQDMHDDLGAVLSITRMHLLQTERKIGTSDEELLSELQNIRHLTENSIENMRRISYELMPPQLEKFGVLQTLETICEQLTASGKTNAELVVKDSLVIADELTSLTLYRVCMELINNTIKHAGATQLKVMITSSDGQIWVHFSDNGKGIPEEIQNQGTGLKNIKSRLSFLGGDFRIDSQQNGFNAIISLPLQSIKTVE